MKNYTKVPNEIFEQSQVSIQGRFLMCVMLKHCGKNESCYPSQKYMARVLGCSSRHVRNLLSELVDAGLVAKRRLGFNRPNTYFVAKSLELERNQGSYHLGNRFPFEKGTVVPDKSTYIKGKDKKMIQKFDEVRVKLVQMRSVDNT